MRLNFWDKLTIRYDAVVKQVVRMKLDKFTVDMDDSNHLQMPGVFDLIEKLSGHLHIVSEGRKHLVMY